MKYKMTIIIISMIVLLTACGVDTERQTFNSGNQDQGFIGYVVKKDADRILVVNSEAKDYSSSGGMSNHYSAIWFSHSPNNIEIGQKVEVWADGGIDQSYPAQGKADRVSVIQSNEPEGAVLSEAEAVRKALSSSEIDEHRVPVIKEVKFKASESMWLVYVTSNGVEDVLEITVEDKLSNQEEELGESPPLLIIKADGKALNVYQSSYCWSSKSQGTCVDYISPNEMLKDKPKDQVKANTQITYGFDVKEPTEVTLTIFHNGTVTQQVLTGDSFQVPQEEGVYYYSLFAVWLKDKEKRISEGDSSYTFAIEVVKD